MTDPATIGLYLHIPFCLRKCLYCDFCSLPNRGEADYDAYFSALVHELEQNAEFFRHRVVDTVFMGGGTPTLFGNRLLKLLDQIRQNFQLASNAEITLEANPATADQTLLRHLREHGFNRLSMGVQSLCDGELSALGRMHTASQAETFYADAVKAGFDNVNVDLMFAIPNQTLQSFRRTLEQVKAWSPSHISVYGLMIEEETPFGRMRESLPLPDEETEEALAALPSEVLGEDYVHYEISNYARRGRECRHNLRYWHSEEYLGLGAAAHSYINGIRFGNTLDVKGYLSSPTDSVIEREVLSEADRAFEFCMLRFRLAEGVDPAEYARLFGEDFLQKYGEVVDKYLALGHMIKQNGRYRLTESGMRISNTVLLDFM